MNSIAKSLIRLNPTQNISLEYFDVETEYQVSRANLNFEGSYQYAAPLANPKSAKDLRVFNITIPAMRYYFGGQGELLVDYERSTNLAWLEWMYNIHKMVKPFLFDHPIYGSLKVRFAEPLKIPKGLKGGQSASESVGVRLIEVHEQPTESFQLLGPKFSLNVGNTYWVHDRKDTFNYPYHLVSTEYESEDTVLSLGGDYQYTVRGSKPEQRIFTLHFDGLRYSVAYDDKIIGTESDDDQLSMQHLENFYFFYRLHKPFYYPHPTQGRIKVRFKEPLKIPKLRPNGNGWTEAFTITLVEVIEDAKRYL